LTSHTLERPGDRWASARRVFRAVCVLGLATSEASAHEFEVHDIPPTDDWCAIAHELAEPGDLLQLQAGTYAGGCDLTLGGDPSENEALGVHGDPSGGTIIAADADGLSLRISGEPTRLYLVHTEGTVHITAPGVTVDRCTLGCLQVMPGLDRVTVLFSTLHELVVDVRSAVLRGNQLGDVSITAAEGLVHENTVHGSLHTTVSAERNLVFGALDATDAIGNVVMGPTTASGDLLHNTLLGEVVATGRTENNLTIATPLPEAGGNLQCSECLRDVGALDVQLTTATLDAPILPMDPPVEDFCGLTANHVGAVGSVGNGWWAHDRDIFGCAVGLVDSAPETPEGSCAVLESPDTGSPVDTGTPGTSPSRGVVLEDDPGGCDTAPSRSWTHLLRRRRTP